MLVAALAAAAAALLLVAAVVGRSGLADAGGTLRFLGRDSTDDPIVYAAAALRLLLSGLPLTHPFAAGAPATAQYVGLAGLAGLHAISGVPMLDLAFRCLPAFDAIGAALAAVALARALGATPAGAGAAGGLLVLGGGAPYVVPWLGAALGRAVQPLDSWAFFGPYLLAFNPIAAALGGLFAAFLLLADPAARTRTAPAVCAGLLVASLFETKLFLFAPAFAGLAATALLRPPAELARPLRLATALALAGALPSLVEKALAARSAAGVGGIGFALCPGCLPRYLLNASLGSHDVSFEIFKTFRLAACSIPGRCSPRARRPASSPASRWARAGSRCPSCGARSAVLGPRRAAPASGRCCAGSPSARRPPSPRGSPSPCRRTS